MEGSNNTTVVTHGMSAIEIVEVVYLSQIAFLTIFGNCMVILAFVRGPRTIRSYTNYFVVSLATTDLMVGCFSLPFWIVFRADPSLISENLYNAIIPLDVLTGITSILCLAAISIERMLAVKFPRTHMYLTERSVMLTISATWIIGVLLSFSMYGSMVDLRSISIYTASIFVVGYLIPLCVITASYCVIFHTSLHMTKSANENATKEREMRVTKTISLVFGLFVISWSPFFIINMIYVFCNHCAKPKWPIYVSKVMHYTNSMMNFFVYSRRSPDFRNFFKSLLDTRERKMSNKSNTSLSEANKIRTLSAVSGDSRCPFYCPSDSPESVLLPSQYLTVKTPV